MILKPILAGYFRLDGGAMFGVVPKKIWSKLCEPDENNLCQWALRCLYIEHGPFKILIDTGLGTKQDARFFSHYQPTGNQDILNALVTEGIRAEDLTDIILSHLHFDHVGGAVSKKPDGSFYLNFPNARHWVHSQQWLAAHQPNQREKASFLKENLELLNPVIQFVDTNDVLPWHFIQFYTVFGHTEAMILPLITINESKKILFCADLFPSIHHIPIPYVMAYDMQPLKTLQEKTMILETAHEQKIAMFFEHDDKVELCQVQKSKEGKFVGALPSTLEAYLESQEVV
jgi:glyoxylase-like metal-dependent hydrolase (beta-lactamase superfamily II)